MKRNAFLVLVFILFGSFSFAQEDNLLKEIDGDSNGETLFELPAFKALQIGNLESTKTAHKKDLYFIVSHRFGSVKNGFDTFFGLDDSNTKIQFVYGLTDFLQLNLGRESFNKTYSGALKVKLLKQSNKSPVNIVLYTTANINTLVSKKQLSSLTFSDRLSYATQILVSKRMSKKLSLEIAPTYVRQNLQNLSLTNKAQHNQFAMAIGGRYKISKRMSVNADYTYNFNQDNNNGYNNPLTIGVDLETGGHIFQLLFTNAQSMNTPGFVSYSTGDWTKGDVFFGFNLVRVF